jgi:hypothetical protein
LFGPDHSKPSSVGPGGSSLFGSNGSAQLDSAQRFSVSGQPDPRTLSQPDPPLSPVQPSRFSFRFRLSSDPQSPPFRRFSQFRSGSGNFRTGSVSFQVRFRPVQTRFSTFQAGSFAFQAGSVPVQVSGRFRPVQVIFSSRFNPVSGRFSSLQA